MLKFTIKDDLSKRLRELGPKIARKHGRKAVRAGAKPVLDEARRRVAVDTGALKKSLRIVSAKPRGSTVGAQVRSLAPHAHLVEFGTVKMAAQPFLRPALDARAQEALDRMGAVIADAIEQEEK
jgi:HK97 gp10 family phage protein